VPEAQVVSPADQARQVSSSQKSPDPQSVAKQVVTDPFILQVKELQKQGLLAEAEATFALEKHTVDDKKMKMIY
jgi:hypothetical protein